MTTDTLAAGLEREHHEIDAGIEEFLPARAHGRHRPESLRRATAALRRHIFLEEQFLFRPLRDNGLMIPLFVMLREHGEIWEAMNAVEAQLNCHSGGQPSDVLYRALLDQHNTEEEAVIYPQADVVLSAGADAEPRAFLAAGQMPDGWVCEQAGA